MAKWYGTIGYVETVQTEPGIWEEKPTERNYYGDLIRNTRKLYSTGQVNDSINISNSISIVADPYAKKHFYAMRYITFEGAKWKITDVDASQPPRLIISLGGLYNE